MSDPPLVEPAWLTQLREIAALAQTGLHFGVGPYDLERYARIRTLAIALLAERGGVDPAQIAGLLDDRPGYVTPRLEVRGACFRNDEILLVREVNDGRWAMPGGFVDINLTPSGAIEAEIQQESGFLAKARRLVAVYDRRLHVPPEVRLLHCHRLFFICDLVGGEARPSLETSAVQFFPEDRLPPLSLGRTTEALIKQMFTYWRQPDLPTVFD